MYRLRTYVAGLSAGVAVIAAAFTLGTGVSAAAPVLDRGCQTGSMVPTADPHEYDTCIHDDWGNVRRCPPWTVVTPAGEGEIVCTPE
ncbi:hypothetical protein [Nocardia sp. NPDC020380]|uniref:hypothetical protein n=1 Tax=Nocardia sp. NPDC020380 TaxID=3364309 RepID=UPI0037BDFA65